mgnify:CR=1 FL=1
MPPPVPPIPPVVELPTSATERCPVHVLPPRPTLADLETGYVIRGFQIVECDARRRLAVDTVVDQQLLTARWAEMLAEVKR